MKPPRSRVRTTASTSSGETRWKLPATSTRRTERSSAKPITPASAATAARPSASEPARPQLIAGIRQRGFDSTRVRLRARRDSMAPSTLISAPRPARAGWSRGCAAPAHRIQCRRRALPGHQRVARHSRRRVDLEQPVGAAGIAHQVDAAPAGGAGGGEGAQRERADRGLGGTVKARTDILGGIGNVLGVVVVVLARRHDPDRGQRHAVEDADRVLATLDQRFHQQLAAVLLG